MGTWRILIANIPGRCKACNAAIKAGAEVATYSEITPVEHVEETKAVICFEHLGEMVSIFKTWRRRTEEDITTRIEERLQGDEDD